jgi:hypothetical protein
MPEFGERFFWYALTAIALGGAALLTPQITTGQRAIGWAFTGVGICTIFYIESSGILSFLHRGYSTVGAPYPRLSLVLVTILGGLLFGGGWWFLGASHERGATTSASPIQPTAPPPLAPAPPITVRYQLTGGLPIEVPGYSTLNVLQIYPAKDQMPWFFQVTNNGSERSFWPEQKLKPEQAMGFITRCEAINLGQAAVINLVLDFVLEYSREIPDPNHPKQTTSGPVFARGIRRAMISLLQPNTPFVFYIVNQSPFYVAVTPPKMATIQMLEESVPRQISLVQPQASVEDLFALHLTFFPSRYPWKGLPESAIH